MKQIYVATLVMCYEPRVEPPRAFDIARDPRFLSEPWEEAVMFAAAEDALLEPEPDELEVLFADRSMGVVVYADYGVDAIVTVLVKERGKK